MIPPPAAAGCAAVGDIVLCRDASYRENLKVPGELGLVLEARSDRARVYFQSIGAEPWIPTTCLARVRDPGAGGVPPWMQRACAVARRLQAMRIEIAELDPELCSLRVFHGEVELSVLDGVRAELGDALRRFSVAPSGMHKLEAAIAYSAAPPPP